MYKIWVPAWIWVKIVQKMQKLDREGGRGYVINCCRLHYPKAWFGTDLCQGQAHLHGPVQQTRLPSLSSPSNRNQGHWLDCWSQRTSLNLMHIHTGRQVRWLVVSGNGMDGMWVSGSGKLASFANWTSCWAIAVKLVSSIHIWLQLGCSCRLDYLS